MILEYIKTKSNYLSKSTIIDFLQNDATEYFQNYSSQNDIELLLDYYLLNFYKKEFQKNSLENNINSEMCRVISRYLKLIFKDKKNLEKTLIKEYFSLVKNIILKENLDIVYCITGEFIPISSNQQKKELVKFFGKQDVVNAFIFTNFLYKYNDLSEIIFIFLLENKNIFQSFLISTAEEQYIST